MVLERGEEWQSFMVWKCNLCSSTGIGSKTSIISETWKYATLITGSVDNKHGCLNSLYLNDHQKIFTLWMVELEMVRPFPIL